METKAISVNIHKFYNMFRDYYEYLYKEGRRKSIMRETTEAAVEFDEKMNNPDFADFVREFVEYRGDAIASDREAAAFMGALDMFDAN